MTVLYRWTLGLALSAMVALAILILTWTPFDLAFWAAFWTFYTGLVLSMACFAVALFRSTRRWLRPVSLVPGVLVPAALGALGVAVLQLTQLDASIGWLQTAEDQARPDGRQVRVAWLQLPATAPGTGTPIVYLAGGPGGSGVVTLLLATARRPAFEAMREFGDVIVLDQRGTMPWTVPWLACPDTWNYPLDEPMTAEKSLLLQQAAIQDCETSGYFDGLDPAGYTTDQSAHDLEALRLRLGVARLTLWATSYGTHLAFAYLRLYPDRVDRMILHGTEGPDHTLKMPSAMQAGLAQVADLAAADPELQMPAMREDIAQIVKDLATRPVSVAIDGADVLLGPWDIQLLTSLQLRSAGSRARLPAIVARMKQGDFETFGRRSLALRNGRRESLMAVYMDCASGVSPSRLMHVERESATSLLAGAVNAPFPELCVALGLVQADAEFRQWVSSDVPALFISGTMDGRTPVSNAEEAMAYYSRGEHIVVEGAGHGDELFVASPEIIAGMQQFMRGEPISNLRPVVPFRFE